MTRLSVNINKVALLRNSRGGGVPNVLQVARDCEHFGAQGITVHPRPDERHIKRSDIAPLKEVVTTEFNIEGYPSDDFVEMVLATKPAQVTLVPDAPGQLTSDHGWDAIAERQRLSDLAQTFKAAGVRMSIFLDPDARQVEAAAKTGTDRIEFYTGPYAYSFRQNPTQAVAPYVAAGKVARELGLGVNAGHDLDTRNLPLFVREVPDVLEVSIGHALIADALYYGLANTIAMYLRACKGFGPSATD
jgi:pyridoxine 5-phosphate synthase